MGRETLSERGLNFSRGTAEEQCKIKRQFIYRTMSSAGALRTQGNEYLRQKRYMDAYRYFQEALAKCPPTDKAQLSEIYSQLSATELVLEKVMEALQSANNAVENNKNNARAYVRRANAYSATLRWKEAYDDYQTALKLQPDENSFEQRMKFAEAKAREAGSRPPPEPVMPEPEPVIPASPVREPRRPSPAASPAASPKTPPASAKASPAASPVASGDPKYNAGYAERLMRDLLNDRRPSMGDALDILTKISDMHRRMPNIVHINVNGTLHIIGDTHGQFQDVVALFDKFGVPSPRNPYLFNGDFVDRGSMGVEIILTLFAWKLACPNGIFLNRGNHEQRSMNMMYGFEKECSVKYNQSFFEEVSEVFNTLPIGHVINGKVFVVHGGLPSDPNVTLEKVQQINRIRQPPESGPINDMLWSDPMARKGLAPSPRGITSTFGPDITERFLAANKLDLLIRSHEAQDDGYQVHHGGKCITVFSAPNYMGQMRNKGAICNINFRDGGYDAPKFVYMEAEPIPAKYPPMKYASFGGW